MNIKNHLILLIVLTFTSINGTFADDKNSHSAQSNDRHYHNHNHHGHYGHHHDHYYKPHHHKPHRPHVTVTRPGYFSDNDLRGKNYTFIRSYKEWDNIGREWITCADYHVRSETLPVKYCRYYYGWKKIGTIPYKGAIIK